MSKYLQVIGPLKGEDGKSAYQYAQDGGYTGTEAEFAEKLAAEGDTYTLPVASAAALGGVQPVAKTEAMTQSVGVDEAGALWTAPSGGVSFAEWTLLGEYTMLVSDRSLVIDLSQFEGITHFRIIGNCPKCSEDCGILYLYLGTAYNNVQSQNKQNTYALRFLGECELFDGQLYGFLGVTDGWSTKIPASVVAGTPRDSGKCTRFKMYYSNAVNDTTENTIQIWGY